MKMMDFKLYLVRKNLEKNKEMLEKIHNNKCQEDLEDKEHNKSQKEEIVKDMLEKEHNSYHHVEEIDKEKIK